MTVEEYRKLLDDYTSSGEQIERRLRYLEALCKKVIGLEIEKYVAKSKENA